MSVADVVGFLPAPTKAHAGAADILEQSCFAYGVATSICVYEVHRLHAVCTLQGGHRATVTAVKWCPAYHTRDFAQPSHVRIASGDSDGSVVVWDVLSASQLARLDDVPAARDMLRDYIARNREYSTDREKDSSSAPSETGITSLAWVMPDNNVLAVVLAPALLLLWDVTTGGVLWKRELSSGPQLFGQLAVAPLDSRQISLCGSSGALVVLQLTDPGRDKVAIKQYRVNMQAQESTKASSSSLQALFPASPGLLVLLLPRELVLFDLQLGAPAANTPLPSNLPAFSHLLGVFGGGTCHGLAEGDGGLDFAYCAHVDGSLSVWVRVPGALKYKLGSSSRLIPPPIRGAVSQVFLAMVKACLWRQLSASEGPSTSAQTAASTAAIAAQLNRSLAAMHLATLAQGTPAGPRKAEGAASVTSAGGSANSKATILSPLSLLVMAVTSDGRLWQWQVALPRYPRRSFVPISDDPPISAITSSSVQAARAATAPATVMPQLAGLLHGLPGSITAMSLQPWPMLLPKHIGKLDSSIKQSSNSSRHAASQQQLQESLEDHPFTHPTGTGLQEAQDAASTGTGSYSLLDAPTTTAAAGAGEKACDDTRSSEQPSAAECVVIGAAATSTGHIELFSLRHGHINPIHVEVVASHAVHKDVRVRGVRWLGSSPVLVSFSSEKSSGGWRNSLMLTDVRTGKSLPFRDSGGSDTSPLLGIRVSPSGAYLLLVFKAAPTELWATLPQLPAAAATAAAASQASSRTPSQPTSRASSRVALAPAPAAAPAAAGVGADVLTKPWRMRLLDLPFGAVEWVSAEDEMQQGLINVWSTDARLEAAVTAAAASQSSSAAGPDMPLDRRLSRQVSWGVGRVLSALQLPSMSVAADTDSFPVEMLAFALVDGRSGVLSVRGRKVSDKQPKRPAPGERPSPGETAGTALACVWPLLVQGDADGGLLLWDLVTGRCNSLATGGFGQVRKLQVAPASPPALSGALEAGLGSSSKSAPSNGSERMRVAVLFSSGAFGVYEVDAAGRLRATAAHPSALARVGRALDVSWVTMPGAAGAGSILAVVLEDGSLSLLDVGQCQAKRRSFKAKQELLHQVLRTPSAAQLAVGSTSNASLAVALVPPQPLGSSIMLQQPWVMLLRCLLQLGISQNALLYISSSSTEEDDDVHRELQQLLPRSARATLAHIASAAAAGIASIGSLRASALSSSSSAQTMSTSDVAVVAARTASAASKVPGSRDRAEQLAKTKSSPLLKMPLGPGDLPTAAVAPSNSARPLAGAVQQQVTSPSQQPTISSSSSRPSGDASIEQLAAIGIEGDSFDGDLVKLLRHIAKLRGTGQLLHAHEWKAYTEALKSGSVAQRMAVAAQLSGHHDEARFWSALPATLKRGVKPMLTAIQAAQQQQQQQALASNSSLAAAAPADVAPASSVSATVAAATSQLSASVRDSQALSELDHLDSLDDYDRMVQQALGSSSGSNSSSSHRASVERARGAPKAAAAGSASTAAGPTEGLGSAATAAAAPGQAALTRRGSGVPMPGHVRVTSTGAEQFSAGAAIKLAAAGRPVLLDEQLILSDAQERLLWHEALPAQLFEAEGALELRLLEYVVLGDFQTAVAFLLSTPPENSVSYYRSVVCALALAATASTRAQSASTSSIAQPAATLHQQAAKVVSAHAASIGDTLLGVPLNCSAGLNADAVQVLQEAGMWQFAAILIARTLTGTERAQALSRWANYALQQEGSVWRCVGILTSAGCLSAAAQVLRGAGLPDCAQAYVLACKQAGLLVKPTAAAAAQQQGQLQVAEQDGAVAASSASCPRSVSAGEDDIIIAGKQEEELELFDLLGQRTRMLPRAVGAAEHEWVSGPDELRIIRSEYQSYLSTLLSSL